MGMYGTWFHIDSDADVGPPWVYTGGFPTADQPRGGQLEVGYLGKHITYEGLPQGEYGERKDWIRIGVHEGEHDGTKYPGDGTVVLNREQVVALRDALTAWLESEDR